MTGDPMVEAWAEIDAIEAEAGLQRLELTVPPFDPDPRLISSTWGDDTQSVRRWRREAQKHHEAAERQRRRLW